VYYAPELIPAINAASRPAGIQAKEYSGTYQRLIFADQASAIMFRTGQVERVQCSQAGLAHSDPMDRTLVTGRFTCSLACP